ncbi:MAG: hypothetical protein HRU72_02010 [Planctomycetia bacterium]|nr:hypothetical protein [Candidatus Brocadia sp.]QOJ05418.1 MAG: hypothetical protein HRU72_02010 [Planctomycetia bacterium]TVL98135.1 MAG: hypothetical protein CV082_01750 [Candidatus Brocadia sp. BL1]HQU30616.1 hypothetical protein [Candidatus Brocadia sapporoensis]
MNENQPKADNTKWRRKRHSIEDEKETCTESIEVFEQQQEFGIIPISAVQSPIRQILGVETTFGEGKRFSRQSIKDNVSLLDEETINKTNKVVVRKAA